MAFGIFLLAILYPCIVWEQRITFDTILSSINWMALQQTTIFFTSFELEKLCSHFTTPPFSPFMESLQQILQAPKSVLLEKFLFYSNPPVNSQTKFYNQNKKNIFWTTQILFIKFYNVHMTWDYIYQRQKLESSTFHSEFSSSESKRTFIYESSKN